LADAAALKAALADSPDLLAIVTSSWFRGEVVRDAQAVDSAPFRPIAVCRITLSATPGARAASGSAAAVHRDTSFRRQGNGTCHTDQFAADENTAEPARSRCTGV
jgi:hypothetical protein